MLVAAFPRLLVCDLTFTQMAKHSKRLRSYLDVHINLKDRLSTEFTANIQGVSAPTIYCCDDSAVSTMSFPNEFEVDAEKTAEYADELERVRQDGTMAEIFLRRDTDVTMV